MAIIACIANCRFVLKDIKQAETLLNILAEAQQVDRSYTIERGYLFVEADFPQELSISIEKITLVSREELQAIKVKDREAEGRAS